MRKGLIILFSVGTVLGFGSGFARLAHRGSCHERWSQRYDQGPDRFGYGRYDRFDRFDRAAPVAAPAPAPAPAAAPVYIVVPAASAAQAPVIVNNAPAPAASPAPAPVINVAPAPAAAQ